MESGMASAPEAPTVAVEWPEPEQCAVDVGKIEDEQQERVDEGARANGGKKEGVKREVSAWRETCVLL